MSGSPNVEPRKAVVTLPVPTSSMFAVNRVVSALFSYKRPGNYQDLAGAASLHPVTVSQALSMSRDLGLTRSAGKRGQYVLTQKGEDYARLVQSGKEDQSRLLLREMIVANPFWSEIVAFLRASMNMPRDPLDLVLDVERKSGKKWSPAMRRTVREGYMAILEYSGLVSKDGEKMVVSADLGQEGIPPSAEPEQASAELGAPSVSQARPPAAQMPGFVQLRSDDFVFQLRKDPSVIAFAESQFAAWIEYLKKSFTSDAVATGQTGAK